MFFFCVLRVLEFSALVGTAASLEKVRYAAKGVTNASPFFLPLMAALGLYWGFGYIVVSASAFGIALVRSRKRPVSLMLTNAVPLAIWGSAALLLIYGGRMPASFALALGAGVLVNVIAAYFLQRAYGMGY